MRPTVHLPNVSQFFSCPHDTKLAAVAASLELLASSFWGGLPIAMAIGVTRPFTHRHRKHAPMFSESPEVIAPTYISRQVLKAREVLL